MKEKKVLVFKYEGYRWLPYKSGTVVSETNSNVLVKYDGLFSGSEWVLKERELGSTLPFIETIKD
jgi:hypothetical protein